MPCYWCIMGAVIWRMCQVFTQLRVCLLVCWSLRPVKRLISQFTGVSFTRCLEKKAAFFLRHRQSRVALAATDSAGWDHRSIYKYLDGGLLSLSIDQMRAPQTQLSCPACITLTHARQPKLSSVRKFQNEISLGRRAHVRKMFVSLTHSPDSAYNIHMQQSLGIAS